MAPVFLRYLARGVAGTVTVAGLGVGGFALVDKGFRRECVFWRTAVPILAHYKWVSWRYEDEDQAARDARYEVLHQAYAPVVLDMFLSLRGLYVKFGQVLSVRPELVPQVRSYSHTSRQT